MPFLAEMGITFSHPAWLLALLALPVLALLEWRAVQRAARAARLLVGPRQPNILLAQQLPRERVTSMGLRLGAITLLLLGASGPQWGHETVRRQSRGSDLVFAIDVSRSMDARDVSPSRLDEARREAMGLLDRVEGSRVGVLVFAGDAVRLCPLTLDHDAARLVLQTLSTSSVSMPGTDLGRALESAAQMLPAGRRDEQAIVLWTDGEDLEGNAERSLTRMRTAGTRVFAVGVGTPAGEVIPEVDETGRVVDVHRDENGNVVRSQLGEKFLRELASATRGAYFPASRPGGELGRLALAMGSLARSQRGARLMERPVARFTWFALLAALLLIADQARWRRTAAGLRLHRPGATKRGAAAAAVFVLALVGVRAARAETDWARGDRAFRAGQWARAESLYARRAGRNAPAPVLVNLATSRARQGKENAPRDLSRLTAQPGLAGQAAGYNLGTLYGEQHDPEHAIQELRRALERDPNDADARWNYELMMRAEQQKQQPKQQPKQDEKQKPKPNPSRDQKGQQGQGQPPPQPSPQQPQGAPSNAQPQSAQPGGAPGMTKEQAEKLLGSLEELERLEKQKAKQVHVMRERKGKDW
jgi:Ca-activated chloride channel family protein